MAASVRYIVHDVEAALNFYTQHLGFKLERNSAPAFASVTRDDVRLLLSGPGSSGARPLPDGRRPAPGGWNRILIMVPDVEAEVARLRTSGARFRSEIIKGVGGSQIWLEDPSGNLVELLQPADKS
jgi:catechol 2,3-dioxygenase-like lactoylglutathione lyase family enzyme